MSADGIIIRLVDPDNIFCHGNECMNVKNTLRQILILIKILLKLVEPFW